MTDKTTMTWLSFLTKGNYEKRRDNHLQSLRSLWEIDYGTDLDVIIVDNSEPDNFECIKLRDQYCKHIPIFKTNNLFYDVAAHYVAYYHALSAGNKNFI